MASAHMFGNLGDSNRGPMGLWDGAKATADDEGGVCMIGGSMVEDGHTPQDTHPGASVSGMGFYNEFKTQSEVYGGNHTPSSTPY